MNELLQKIAKYKALRDTFDIGSTNYSQYQNLVTALEAKLHSTDACQ